MQLLPFLAVSALLIVAPGPDMALVARNALRAGARGGILTSLGSTSGLAIWSLAASAGVAALLRASEPAFLALKVVGAMYLVWLGAQAQLAAWRRDEGPAPPQERTRRFYRQGLVSNLGNPKIAVFFTSSCRSSRRPGRRSSPFSPSASSSA